MITPVCTVLRSRLVSAEMSPDLLCLLAHQLPFISLSLSAFEIARHPLQCRPLIGESVDRPNTRYKAHTTSSTAVQWL